MIQRTGTFCLCAFLLALLGVMEHNLYAETQDIIPLGSSVYTEMDSLYLLQGLAAPTGVRPWTKVEARSILHRIDSAALSGVALSLYDNLDAEIAAQLRMGFGDLVRLDANMDVNLEMYTHTNGEDFYNEEDWVYGWGQRQPLAKVTLHMTFGDWFAVVSDFEYTWNFNTMSGDTFIDPTDIAALIPLAGGGRNYPVRVYAPAYASAFTLNIPPLSSDLEVEFPKRAVLSFGGDHWSLSLGRDRLQWGNGHTGNFLIGGHRDFENFIRFSAFAGNFRYDLLTTIYDKFEYDDTGAKSRYFQLHRLEFRILPTLSLALSENIMYQDAYFNIRYLNPAFIYHNWYESDLFNALAHLELDFAFAPGWNLYGQATLDQARAPNEGDSEADGWGILAGVEWARAINMGKEPAILGLSLEAVYTTPSLYRRERVDFLVLNRRYSFNAGDVFSFEYIGYQYGGDALVIQLDGSLDFPGKGAAALRLFWMAHGAMNPFHTHNINGDNTGHSNYTEPTPLGGWGNAEQTFVASLSGNASIPQPFKWLELSAWAQLDYIAKTNKFMLREDAASPVYQKSGLSHDLQLSLGLGITL
jgi:hypothetical protein